MNCPCRTSALRIFVRSIAQIQLSAAARNPSPCRSSPSLLLLLSSRTPRGTGSPPFAVAANRHFHASSRIWSARLEAAVAVEGVEPVEDSRGGGGGDKLVRNFDSPRAAAVLPEDGSSALDDATEQTQAQAQARSSSPKKPRQRWTKKASDSGSSAPQLSRKRKAETKKPKEARARTEATADNEDKEDWQIQKAALKEKFPEGWSPRKKLSPDAIAGIRALHRQFPEQCTTEVLARQFQVSPEAIRRILKSKWAPSAEEEADRQERWFERGKRIWSRLAELGSKPPLRWRQEGVVRDPYWHARRAARGRAAGGGVSAARLRRKRLAENLM